MISFLIALSILLWCSAAMVTAFVAIHQENQGAPFDSTWDCFFMTGVVLVFWWILAFILIAEYVEARS